MVFSVMGFGIIRIGENSSCNVSQAPVNCLPNSLVREGTEKVPLSSDLKRIMVQTVIWWVAR